MATSTPTTSTPGETIRNESQRSLQTPIKCMGHLYNSQQYKTPSSHGQSCSRLCQSSPHVKSSSSVFPGLEARILTPTLHTPSSYQGNKKATALTHTPGKPYNPFDSNLLDRLDGSVFSPNVFAEVRSASQTPKTFQWTVDERAVLMPADIDELQHQPDAFGAPSDTDMEKRAQQVIDAYFAKNLIAPSPWSENGQRKPFVLPRTPKTPAGALGETESYMMFAEREPKISEKKLPVKDTGCQTMLSLPVNFDMKKVLGDYHMKPEDLEGEVVQDLMSLSSLRRKLFFNGEAVAPPSPVRSNKTPDSCNVDHNVSPVKHIHKTPKQYRRSSRDMQTPGSGQFSSSPISSSHSGISLTPFLHRYSMDPNVMASPGFSPISSENSIPSHAMRSMTPLCRPLMGTPGSERVSQPFESPGMSPIPQQQDDRFTPCSLFKNDVPRKPHRSDNRPLPVQLLTQFDDEQLSSSSLQHMDVESDQIPKPPQDAELSFICSQEDKFTMARHRDHDDTQYSDEELSNQESCQAYFTSQASQDTGYNTNSLQLTNTKDPLSSLHTNLTQQFGSFPFSSQDITEANYSAMDVSQTPTKKSVVRHMAVKSHAPAEEIVLNDREVRRRAKQALGKSLDDSLLGASLDSSTLKPMILLSSIGVPPLADVRSKIDMAAPDAESEQGTTRKILPSQLATDVLQKAGEDFRRYCYEPDLQIEDLHAGDAYHHINMDSENTHGLHVSLSAEF